MVQSSSISITPSTHAANHVIGGTDPLVTPILTEPDATMVDETASRVLGTTYHNAGTTMMQVMIIIDGAGTARGYVDTVTPAVAEVARVYGIGSGQHQQISFIVPAGYYYALKDVDAGAPVIQQWIEFTL